MNNYCDKCKVEIEEKVSHCPLCGRCINEELADKPVVHENFPTDHKFQKDKREAKRAIITGLLLINAFSIVCELLLCHTFVWSLHILIGSIFAFFALINPIMNNWSLVNNHSIFYILFVPYVIFLENVTNSFGWGITLVIPLFVVAFSLYHFSMVLSNLNTRAEHFLPMIILTFISIGSFIYNYVAGLTLWPSLAGLLVSIAAVAFLAVFKSEKIAKILAKKFHL
ncbi:MAG: DUF6320 domain-containing protein [Spirochaetales bacterium]